MRFPINVELKDDVWSGTCPSNRGVSATGGTLAELRSSLSAELISQLHQLMDRRTPIRLPEGDLGKDIHFIELPFRAIAKLKVYEAMLSRKVPLNTLANMMMAKPSQVEQLFDLNHWTRTSVIEEALNALGYSVKMELADLDTNPEFVFGGTNYGED